MLVKDLVEFIEECCEPEQEVCFYNVDGDVYYLGRSLRIDSEGDFVIDVFDV